MRKVSLLIGFLCGLLCLAGTSNLAPSSRAATGALISGPLTFSNSSGTITLGGTSQALLTASTTRNVVIIQNPSVQPGGVPAESIWIEFGATAAVVGSPSLEIPAGSSWTVETGQAINVIATTTGHAFTCKTA